MAEIPKIVRERLKAAGVSAVDHPDPDTLTAFAQRALSDRERQSVLEHLAGCGECREVLALALPPSGEAPLLVAHSRSHWLAWPVLRWGFAVAGVVLVGSLGIVQYERHSRESVASSKAPAVSEAKPVSVARNEAPPAVPPPPSAIPVTDEERDKNESSADSLNGIAKAKKLPATTRLREEVPSVRAPMANDRAASQLHGAIGGPLPHGPKMGLQMNQANQWQQNTNAFTGQAAGAPVAAPTQTQNVANLPANGRSEAALDQVQAEPSSKSEGLTLQSQALSQQTPQGGAGEQKVDRAKPLETVIVSNSKRYAGTPPSARLAKSSAAVGERWTINPRGGLQRSVDQGATWQDVNVVSPAAAGDFNYAAKERQAVTGEKTTLKDQKQLTVPTIFRAVAANGSDVWAGGVNGVLYHSTDAGNHWTRVVPVSSGIMLTGDIVRVNFPDALHGWVATSTSEVWATGDGGQSWQKQ